MTGGKLRDEAPIETHGARRRSVELLSRGERVATQRSIDEAEIRRRIDELAKAIRSMNLERVMSTYAPGIVSFDIGPPLRYAGTQTKAQHWTDAFSAYQSPLEYELREVTITSSEDVAFAHSLNRVSGTLKNGRRSALWLRWTACFRKIDGHWLIGHDHVSVPVELESSRAALDLEP